MLSAIPALAFDDLAAKTYGAIVASAGYSRRKLLDRMIAAQALVHRATLVTFNPDDFSDIPWSLVAGVAVEVAEEVLVKTSARTNDLPAHNLQAFDFQVLDSHIVRNQGRAKSLGVGRNHDVKCSRTPPETLGTDTNSGMGLGCGFIPWVN